MEGHEKQTTIYGIVCAEPICRTTPLGRTVTSLIIAISEKEYISCIFRGKMHVNATDQISVTGNMEHDTIYAMAYNASK